MSLAAAAWGQSETTGAIGGAVTDQSGAVVVGAAVTAVRAGTGVTHSTVTLQNGTYLLPLLEPGEYTVTVAKSGFQTGKQAAVDVQIADTVQVNMRLQVGSASTTVEVTTLPPLIQPQNANTTMTLEASQLSALPNPGNDITQFALTSQGAVADVHGGSSLNDLYLNGVTGATVQYTIDGMDADDPFLNEETSGPSNMLLGQNTVAEMTVNSNAYDVTQGRMAAGQVNFISKSGTDHYHGNLMYEWNGRVLNAYDTFTESTAGDEGEATPSKPFDNVNIWAGSFGGPIPGTKRFTFYFDNEGIRIDLPIADTNVKVPTPDFINYAESFYGDGSNQSYITANTGTVGLYDTSTSLDNTTYSSETTTCTKSAPCFQWLPLTSGNGAWLQDYFKLFGNTTPGTYGNVTITPDTSAVSGCPLGAGGTIINNGQTNYTTASGGSNPIPAGTDCVNYLDYTGSAKTPETYTEFRLDFNQNANNTYYWKFSNDQGWQTTGVNPVNSLFDEDSFQPQRDGLMDWTHIFTPTLVNDFQTGFLWYGAIFVFDQPSAEQAALGGSATEIASPFETLGSTSFPQGRNVTQYQFVDNLSWTKGKHQFKFGENFRRELVTDEDDAIGMNPALSVSDYDELIAGVATSSSQSFPTNPDQRFKDFALDTYAMDTWRITRKLTLTYGLRATHNSNVYDSSPLLADWDDFTTFSHYNSTGGALAAPLNADVTGTNQLWNSVPFEIWQPRGAIAWQVKPNTVLKAGWGMFSQVPAASVADTLSRIAPFDVSFTGGISSGDLGANGSAAGCALATPGTQPSYSAPTTAECDNAFSPISGSVAPAAYLADAAANATFKTEFNNGDPTCEVNVLAANSLGGYTPSNEVNPLGCVQQLSVSALPQSGLKPEMVYQYSAQIEHQFGQNMSFTTGYVGTRSQHLTFDYDDNAYQDACSGCFEPFLYDQFPSLGNNSINGPDPRFTSFTQYRYDGYSRYDSWQNTFTIRNWHGIMITANYTWSHCLTTNTPYQDGDGSSLSATYNNCSIDIPNAFNVSYVYNVPWNYHGAAGELLNGWQIGGATFAEQGTPVYPSMESVSSFVFDSSGPRSTIPLTASQMQTAQGYLTSAMENTYDGATSITQIPPTTVNSINTPIGYAAGGYSATSTSAGDYQWSNPIAFVSPFDSTNGSCYSFTTNTEAVNSANCQFSGNNGAFVRGPMFNWTNLQLTKDVKIGEKFDTKWSIQAYNAFNHPNLSNPSITGVVFYPSTAKSSNPLGLSSSLTSGYGQITSTAGFSNSLLGNENGGDPNPRMLALQVQVVF